MEKARWSSQSQAKLAQMTLGPSPESIFKARGDDISGSGVPEAIFLDEEGILDEKALDLPLVQRYFADQVSFCIARDPRSRSTVVFRWVAHASDASSRFLGQYSSISRSGLKATSFPQLAGIRLKPFQIQSSRFSKGFRRFAHSLAGSRSLGVWPAVCDIGQPRFIAGQRPPSGILAF
jgi:hypothetical protein